MTATVVVPLDGSANAEQALPHAMALARRTNASLLLVSVVDVPVEIGAWTSATATALGQELDNWVADTEAYLRRVAAGITDVPVSHVTKIGTAAREIGGLVRELDDPVIAMSSHGRTGPGRILMGSVAVRLVRDAECPALVVRYQSEPAPATPSFDTVVVPLDGSDVSEHALDELLRIFGTPPRLHLVRVVDMPVVPAGSLYDPGMPVRTGLLGEYLDAAHLEATEYLDQARERLTARGITVTSEVRHGRVADEILGAAAETQADLIAMATHGRGGLGRIVFGSVAEGVLHASALPLLLVRPR